MTVFHRLVFAALVLCLLPCGAIADGLDARVIPDPALTPGQAASTDQADVCGIIFGRSYSKRHRLSQNEQTKRLVLSRYGVPWEDRANYEDDHNLPLCSGGSDAVENRWPQPRFGTWHAGLKDVLEAHACRSICSGQVSIAEAQSWFLAPADWRDAYCAQIGGPPCPPWVVVQFAGRRPARIADRPVPYYRHDSQASPPSPRPRAARQIDR